MIGTLEVIRLCCTGRAKRLEHISTISVLDAYPSLLSEDIELDLAPENLASLSPYRYYRKHSTNILPTFLNHSQ